MKSVHEIFTRLQERKSQLRIASKKIKEELSAHAGYQKVIEDREKLGAKKSELEASIIPKDLLDRRDQLKLSVKQDRQLLSDIMLTSIMKGESVSIEDKNYRYEPQFSVTLKQIRLDL